MKKFPMTPTNLRIAQRSADRVAWKIVRFATGLARMEINDHLKPDDLRSAIIGVALQRCERDLEDLWVPIVFDFYRSRIEAGESRRRIYLELKELLASYKRMRGTPPLRRRVPRPGGSLRPFQGGGRGAAPRS